MPDDPNTPEGRAEQLRKAKFELDHAKVAVEAWAGTVERIKRLQREHEDPTT